MGMPNVARVSTVILYIYVLVVYITSDFDDFLFIYVYIGSAYIIIRGVCVVSEMMKRIYIHNNYVHNTDFLPF